MGFPDNDLLVFFCLAVSITPAGSPGTLCLYIFDDLRKTDIYLLI